MMTPYQRALRAFLDRSDYERGTITNPFGKDGRAGDRGIARTRELARLLGDPQLAYPTVHVAGSKGKGSTCAFLSTIFTAAGLKTGRYISPHLHTLRERAAIDGESMTEADFVRSFDRVLEASETLERERPDLGRVTAFEISTAMAFEHFAHYACDIAVIEVGLGGTYDATNIVHPELAVITLVDFEHMDILGNTLAEIAENKAGIIKPGVPVLCAPQEPEAMSVIVAAAQRLGSQLIALDDWEITGDWRSTILQHGATRIGPIKLGLAGPHQQQNAALAAAATLTLRPRLPRGEQLSDDAIATGLANTAWPARFEVTADPGGIPVVIDGAHTGASARALVDTLDEEFPNRPIEFVFGMLAAKDIGRMLQQLRRRARHVALVPPANPRAMTLDAMAAAADTVGMLPIPENTLASAIDRAITRAGKNGVVVVTGSLAFAAEAREILGLATTERLAP